MNNKYIGLSSTGFNLKHQVSYYKGKVREVYEIDNDYLAMIATDRISAFDHILPKTIPYKGEVLNKIAAHFLEQTKDIIPNWLLETPHPTASFGYRCEPIKIEMVIRGYLVGHAWREYKAGKRVLCGVNLPEGMVENQKFDEPIITPATKADEGHDIDISKEDIISSGLVSADLYEKLENYTYQLYQRGSEMAAERGLILVDTKYEFGLRYDELLLIDEVHTPDSSRYFYADAYHNNFQNGLPQRHLSKEFVREWLMERNFQGLDGQRLPEMLDADVAQIMQRYFELFQVLMGIPFVPKERENLLHDLEDMLNQCITKYCK